VLAVSHLSDCDAPNNNCISVIGKTVCPSPIDNKYSLDNRGSRDYRENKPTCGLHVAVNKTTGQVTNPHIDAYNPNVYLLNHLLLDWVPDKLGDIFGGFTFIPTGRSTCP
jgi:hypothetical protein